MGKYQLLRDVESNARTYATTFPGIFEGGRGSEIWDAEGRTLIDCLACAGTLPLGHNHPEVMDAVLKFCSSSSLQQALDLSTPAKFEFVYELMALLPREFSESAKIRICSPSGSDAVEAAMKLCRFATQRDTIIAFHGAYHGMTLGALSAMGNTLPKSRLSSSLGGVHFAPYPDRHHCPFGSSGTDTDRLSINYLRTLLADPECGISKPAAVMLEVVQGEGGCVPASIEWLRAIRELTIEHDVPLIVDEVQTGFARTGRMFAIQHAGITPDVLVLSKALGGGYPLAVMLYNRRFDVWPPGTHAGTFRGNQIAMVAGRTTMQILRRDGFAERAAQAGKQLTEGLEQIARRWPGVFGDIRGRGLMIGAEVAGARAGGVFDPSAGVLAKRIKQAAFEHGLLLESGGRHGAVLRFLPPLIVTESDVGAILSRLETAIAGVVKQGSLHGA